MVVLFVLFVLLAASVRFFNVFDCFHFAILWFLIFVIFILFFLVFLWLRRGFLLSIICFSVILLFSHLFFKNPQFIGYSLDYKASEKEDNSNLPTIQYRDFIVSKHFNFTIQPGHMYGIKVGDKVFRKRLHGVPGDKIHICNAKVYVNGFARSVNDRWQRSSLSDFSICDKVNHTFILQQGEYYFLGDNNYKSYDSRHFGSVAEQNIIAKSLYVVRENNQIVNLSVEFN